MGLDITIIQGKINKHKNKIYNNNNNKYKIYNKNKLNKINNCKTIIIIIKILTMINQNKSRIDIYDNIDYN